MDTNETFSAVPQEFVIDHPRRSAGEVIIAHEILRALPPKRLAARAEWNGRTVFLKIFTGIGGALAASREATATRRLIEEGFRSPALLLHAGVTRRAPARATATALVYEWLSDAAPLGAAVRRDRGPDAPFYAEIVGLFARLQAAGFRHTDPHLDNFVRSASELFVVDPGAIRRPFTGLGARTIVTDLEDFLAAMPPRADLLYGEGRQIHAETCRKSASYLPAADDLAWPIFLRRSRMLTAYLRKMLRASSTNALVERGERRVLFPPKGGLTAAAEAFLAGDDSGLVHKKSAVRAAMERHQWSHWLIRQSIGAPQPLALMIRTREGAEDRVRVETAAVGGAPIDRTDIDRALDLAHHLAAFGVEDKDPIGHWRKDPDFGIAIESPERLQRRFDRQAPQEILAAMTEKLARLEGR